MDIAVVILNYNGKSYLEKFLPGVVKHSDGAEIWVADNCSTDDSIAFVKENFPQIKLIINESNGGFAKGYNDALKKITANYYVLLNSDIEVTENWLMPCIKILKENENIAAVQPKILDFNKKEYFEHAGAAGGFLDKDFYPFCQGRIFDDKEKDEGQYDEDREVFWATGACLFIKSNLYHDLGGLDEDFFAHMEEIDLCWRLKGQGYQIWYCADSKIYHVGGGTLNYQNARKTYLNFRNSLYMITKNYQGILFFKLFKRLSLDGIAVSRFLFKLQFSHLWAVLRSHFCLYWKLPSLLRKRKAIKRQSIQFNPTGLYKKSILVKKFISGIKNFNDLDDNDFSQKR